MTTQLKSVAATAATAAIVAIAVIAGGAGTSIAATADTATQIGVSPVATIMPGQKAPFDAPGVRSIRRGKPVPAGYRLVGQKVTITRGVVDAGASLHFVCPDGKRLKTFGMTGEIGPTLDPSYIDKHQTYARAFGNGGRGVATSGVVYAICR